MSYLILLQLILRVVYFIKEIFWNYCILWSLSVLKSLIDLDNKVPPITYRLWRSFAHATYQATNILLTRDKNRQEIMIKNKVLPIRRKTAINAKLNTILSRVKRSHTSPTGSGMNASKISRKCWPGRWKVDSFLRSSNTEANCRGAR